MKILILFLVFVFGLAFWYGESREFVVISNGTYVTAWKTYNNTCYLIAGKYYGLSKPSEKNNYIRTTNMIDYVQVFWNKDPDTLTVAIDSGSSVFHNGNASGIQLIDYRLNKKYNDSLYTYFDIKLKLRLLKKNINTVPIQINGMGAL